LAELLQTELADPLRGQLVVGAGRQLDSVDDRLDIGGDHRPLVGRAEKRRPKLRPVESLPLAVALDHVDGVRVAVLEGREPMAAAGALAAPANGRAVGRTATLQDSRRSVAAGTQHVPHSTSGGVFLLWANTRCSASVRECDVSTSQAFDS